MSALFCGNWWPYLLALLVGLGTAYWAWGGRRRDDDVDTGYREAPKAAPVATPKANIAPVAAAAAVGAVAVAATKKKAAPVKKAVVKPAAKVAATPAKKAAVAKPAAKPVVKKVAAPKATAKPVAKPAVKVAAKPAAAKPKTAAVAKPKAAPKAKAAPKVKPVTFKAVPAPKPKATPKPKAAAKPKAAPKPKVVKSVIPDNLELLKGVGPKLNALLKSLGVSSFEQVANWSARDIREIDSKLGTFAGRIGRDNWVDQAKLLSKGDIAAFEKKYGELGSEINKG